MNLRMVVLFLLLFTGSLLADTVPPVQPPPVVVQPPAPSWMAILGTVLGAISTIWAAVLQWRKHNAGEPIQLTLKPDPTAMPHLTAPEQALLKEFRDFLKSKPS